LGVVTDSYDSEGEIIREDDASQISQSDVENILPQFTGDIAQIPPMYSAIKQGGKKLYELARQGETVEREARSVTIHSLEILSWNAPDFELLVTCSSGTYIRSLAYDIGEALGIGAYLTGLVRTRSGSFTVENALNLDDLLQADEDFSAHLLPPLTALADWQIVPVKDEQIQAIIQGRSIPNMDDSANDYAVAVESDGHLLAILEKRGASWKPHKVFIRD
ncbi:MAG: tRNA pseudouridine(55) synthase TruB, partial [Anaerolineae bacterium]|nr:tRNA pseudouridine(55) synthase TruB [Anaerolineae bacterium]